VRKKTTKTQALPLLLLFIVTYWSNLSPLAAQVQEEERYSIALNSVPLIDALREVLQLTSIDLVYSRELVENQNAVCRAREVSIDEMLRCVLEETNLDYIRSSSGTYILIQKRELEPMYGDLGGGVFDIDTGAPLPYANIMLVNGFGGASTNQDGLFSISSVLGGDLPVAISYIGYESVYDTVQVRPGYSNRRQFFLKAKTTEFDPIVISGLMQRVPSSLLGSGEVTSNEIGGVMGIKTADVLRGASRLAGVSIQQPIADLHIHGGAGNEHVTLLDGVPVRNPVSMGRHLGAFSPLALERLTLRKTGFEARYGSQLTGVVDVEHNLSTDKAFSNAITLDPVSSNGRMMGRFMSENGRELIVMAAARISNWGVYEDQDVRALLTEWNAVDPLVTSFWVRDEVNSASLQRLGGQPEVQFSDLHFGARYKVNPFHQFHASLYRTTNNLSETQGLAQQGSALASSSGFVMLTQNAYSWLNWAGQLRHSWLIGSRSVLTSQLLGSSHNSALNYQAFFEPLEPGASVGSFADVLQQHGDSLETNIRADEGNRIRELGLRVDFNHSVSSSHTLEIGLEAMHVESTFNFFQPFIDLLETSPDNWQYSGYIQDTLPVGRNLVIVPGLRLTYLSSLSPVYAEPRLSIRFDGIGPGIGEYAFRVAGGLYRQFVHQYELTGYGTSTIVPNALFWLPLDGTLSPSRAYHLAFDGLWMPDSYWTVRYEMYSKWLDRLLLFDYGSVQDFEVGDSPIKQSDFIVPADGRSSGIGVGIEYANASFGGKIGYDYSYGKQKFPGRFEDRRVTTPWNIPHQVSVDLSYQLSEQFGVESNWIQQLGRSWAFRRAYYDVFDIWDPRTQFSLPDFQNPGDDTLPAYRRLDMGLKYVWEGKGFRSQLRFVILNVFDEKNVYDYSVEASQEGFNQVPRLLPGRQYTLSMRFDY